MRSEINVTYEKPLIRTISAAELIETIGPVQGYGHGGAGNTGLTPYGLGGGLEPDHFGR